MDNAVKIVGAITRVLFAAIFDAAFLMYCFYMLLGLSTDLFGWPTKAQWKARTGSEEDNQ